MKTAFAICAFLLILLISCKKESFITSPDAAVNITADTLHYDTVFTSTGSITQAFKIINENNQKLKISSVKLMGSSASAFKINVDGYASPEVDNLELEANDSLYVFVSVSVNPNAADLPFVIRDSIQVNYNGTTKWIQLEAWGQNAHFFRNKKITSSETWINDLPYVILGYLLVDTNAVLTINKGCRVYVHADAPLIINGSLQANGEKDTSDRIYFRGDRLDDPYRDFPGGWPGIYFGNTSKDNVLNYVVIKNAYQAIAAEGPSVNINPKIILNQCIIDNAYDAGIIALNSSIQATNCLVSNCGKNLLLAKGGDYSFTHCTVATYSNIYLLHKDPVLFVSNFISINNVPVTADLNAVFRNCIFWGENGTVDNEVIVAKAGSTLFTVDFVDGLMKVLDNPSNATIFTGIINNQSPMFDSINTSTQYYNFRLKSNSPAIDKATNAGVIIDLDGNLRPVGAFPDLGCYEKQ
jgi:hypothetical protein